MKSVRFSKVVDTSGRPEVHLLLIDPARDKNLQRAIKARRVMTVHQPTVGNSTDYGTIGFEKGVGGQVLVFPKSLKAFEGARVVGMKYDLLDAPEVPKSEQYIAPKKESKPKKAPPAGPEPEPVDEAKSTPESKKTTPKKARPKPEHKVGGKAKGKPAQYAHDNVVAFSAPSTEEEPAEEDEAVTELKAGIRQAMTALEAGRQVAAFNLLRRLVE